MKNVDWLKAELDYLENPQSSLEDIALKHGVSPDWIKKKSMKEGWKKKRDKLLEQAKSKIESVAEKSISEQIKQHRKDASYITNTALTEIKYKVESGQMKKENLTSLTRLLEIGMKESRELFPKNLIAREEETKKERRVSPALAKAAHEALIKNITKKPV